MPLQRLRHSAFAAFLLATSWLPLSAQGTTGSVRGRITDASSGRGLGDVQLLVADTRIGTLSAANGDFALTGVPTGTRAIIVRRLGYQPVSRTVTVQSGAPRRGAQCECDEPLRGRGHGFGCSHRAT